MTSTFSHWSVLDISPTMDVAVIRRAYAAKLKITRPEDDRAGFERLRGAYELAMRLARGEAAVRLPQPEAPVASRPSSAPTSSSIAPVERPSIQDAGLEKLRGAFRDLQQLLRAQQGGSSQADAALSDILRSPALENISFEQRVQQQLAELLAASLPESDPLLRRADERFRWSLQEAQISQSPAITAILSRLSALAFLDVLHSDKSPYSPAFRKLQTRKTPLLGWMMVHFNKAGAPGEYQLLQLIRIHHPSLLSTLEPSTIAWWDKFVSRPQVSFPIILVGIIFTALTAFIGGATHDKAQTLLATARTAGVFIALALWKLLLLDWPRHLIRTKLRVASPMLRTGWLPASVVVLLLAVLIPPSSAGAWLLGLLALGAAQWAWIVGSMDVQPTRSNLLSIPLVRVLIYNFVVAIWWLAALSEMVPVAQLHVPVLAALAGSSLGLPAMCTAWEIQFSARQRGQWIGIVALVAALACVSLWLLTPHQGWRPLAAALVIVAVVLHRPMAAMLGRRQQELRFGWMVTCFIGLIALTAQSLPQFATRSPALTGFGLLLATTALLCAAMAAWNERRGRIAPFRDDPVHESLSW